jgi:ubiquinone/menaquinone biosynthesis C-methylase UbiE
VTAQRVSRGAAVTGVDALEEMLAGARRRAPSANLVHGDALDCDVGDGFDRVVLSFVLHNFDAEGRVAMLRRAARAMALDGRLGVLDWALPVGRRRAGWWRWFLRRLEPSPTVPEVLEGALAREAPVAGLRVDRQARAVGGRAQILVLRRAA